MPGGLKLDGVAQLVVSVRSRRRASVSVVPSVGGFFVGKFVEFLKQNKLLTTAAVGGAVVAFVGFDYTMGLGPPVVVALLIAAGLATWGIYRLRTRGHQSRGGPLPVGRVTSSFALGTLAVFVVIQAVPYGRSHSNPPITGEPIWDSARTRELTVRGCFECHSNEVEWPWYSNVAPASWAVSMHVADGRSKVNYQEWDQPQDKADESAEEVEKGSMPPPYFTLFDLHSDADFTDTERAELIAGLRTVFGDEDD